MRHSILFLFAFGGLPLVGCSPDSQPATVGDEFPQIDALVLSLNRVDGSGDQLGDEEYAFEVAELGATHRWVRTTDSPVSLPPPSPEAMDQLVAVVQAITYRISDDCETGSWDFVPFPPRLTIVGETKRLTLQVSDLECAAWDHSGRGPVMSCADFERVLVAVQAIVPEAESETCTEYW